jgi:hypothetical protein
MPSADFSDAIKVLTDPSAALSVLSVRTALRRAGDLLR